MVVNSQLPSCLAALRRGHMLTEIGLRGARGGWGCVYKKATVRMAAATATSARQWQAAVWEARAEELREEEAGGGPAGGGDERAAAVRNAPYETSILRKGSEVERKALTASRRRPGHRQRSDALTSRILFVRAIRCR
eukprot:76212-Pyramimonas_sp.AAC.1